MCVLELHRSDGGRLDVVVMMTQGGVEEDPQTVGLKNWDTITARLADSATLAFLLLQLPQIILNTQNLMAGNQGALFAIPWMVCFLTLSSHHRPLLLSSSLF